MSRTVRRGIALTCTLVVATACGSGGSEADKTTAGNTMPSPLTTSSGGGTTLSDGARKLLNADGADASHLAAYTSALNAAGSHCQDGPYGTAIIVDTAVSALESDGTTVSRLEYLGHMASSLADATNADCTSLSLTIQADLSDGDPVPFKIPLTTHPAVSGAPNLTDCATIQWPVAIPSDVVGQTLDNATTELICFNVDAQQTNGYDPLDHGSDNFRLSEWVVTAVKPRTGTRVGEQTPVLLRIKRR